MSMSFPCFKSTVGQFWAILCLVVSHKHPFIDGLFHGTKKPKNLGSFAPFADEYKLLRNQGFIHESGTYTVCISCFVCDEPARAIIKIVKGHNGHYGCERCQQEGDWQRKMTYPETSCRPRTDIQFDELRYEEHITGYSPLRELGVGTVSDFVLDYMHMVCLDVMKKMLHMWLQGPLQVRVGPRIREQIS